MYYLTPFSLEVYQQISRKFRIEENSPICKKYDIYGWFDHTRQTLSICTERIVSREKAQYYINETLLHEAVHVAQYCKNKSLTPLGIATSTMNLSSRRRHDVEKAVKLVGHQIRQIEMEAFWMEDKPNEVKYVLKKYCL